LTDTVASVTGDDEQQLDHNDPRPLYEQAAAQLRVQIKSGQLAGRLDSEWMIAARYHVSRDTVRRALEILVKEGLVTATRGRGTFARPPGERDD
jgi:DNA-binding GntR family transcriptional regulator